MPSRSATGAGADDARGPIALEPLPPEEAVAYFKAKGRTPHPSFAWQDVWQHQHATAFTVAKSAGYDILGDIHAAVLKAMAEGKTFAQFQKELTPILQDKGWWGRKTMVDPATGAVVKAQLGSPRRLRTIFDVNMRTSYAAGRWNQIERVKARRPYLRYEAVLDRRTRDAHKRWHGTTLPVDDDWWKTHAPPNGWKCRCTIVQLSKAEADELDGPSPGAPKDGPPKPYLNPRTGETVMVPPGIDPGWAYNPGQAALAEHAARVAGDKLAGLPPAIAAAAQADSAAWLLPLLAKEYGRWVDDTLAKTAREPRRVVGALSREVLAELETRKLTPVSGAITIDQSGVTHLRTPRKTNRQMTALSVEDIKRIPELLGQPERVLLDKRDGKLLYVFSPGGDARKGKLVVAMNRAGKLKTPAGKVRVTTNEIINGGLVADITLSDQAFYEQLWPKK